MSRLDPRSRLCMGWTVAFLWPAPIILVVAVAAQVAKQADVSFASFLLYFTFVAALFAFLLVLVRLAKCRDGGESLYGCPTCGYDISRTPHRCPECGTRLIWGNLPGPRDRHLQLCPHREH